MRFTFALQAALDRAVRHERAALEALAAALRAHASLYSRLTELDAAPLELLRVLDVERAAQRGRLKVAAAEVERARRAQLSVARCAKSGKRLENAARAAQGRVRPGPGTGAATRTRRAKPGITPAMDPGHAARLATWSIAAFAFVCILARPFRIPEWVWAAAGATALVAGGLLAWPVALVALTRCSGVALFLVGMMLLAETARAAGLFEWVAVHAARAAAGSQPRLFAIVYGVGVAITVFLSNDATAVVLTPAIAAVVVRAGVAPLPYLFACAFVANAASFVLPISNPANLVVFGDRLPPLWPWLLAFAAPSAVAVVVTYVTMAFRWRRSFATPCAPVGDGLPLDRTGRVAALAVGAAIVALIAAAAAGAPIGVVALAGGVIALTCVTLTRRAIAIDALRGVTWSIVPLVAGLFVIVGGLDAQGALGFAARGMALAAHAPPPWGALGTALGITLAGNAVNNLPVALIAGATVPHDASTIARAALIAVDLGPEFGGFGVAWQRCCGWRRCAAPGSR